MISPDIYCTPHHTPECKYIELKQEDYYIMLYYYVLFKSAPPPPLPHLWYIHRIHVSFGIWFSMNNRWKVMFSKKLIDMNCGNGGEEREKGEGVGVCAVW